MKPYYEDSKAGIVIYHGDCREVLPMLGRSFDMIFTSPPYNLGNTTGGGFPDKKRFGHYSANDGLAKRGGQGKWAGAEIANGYGTCADNMPHDEYVAWQKSVLDECWKTLSDHGAIFYNHKTRILDGVAVTPFEYNPGLPVRQIIIWARAGGINFSTAFYVPTHEWIVIIAKPAWRLRSKGASGVGDVWYVPQEENKLHPAPFPSELPSRAISTAEPTCVLDPFSGIGTTLIAAKDQGVSAVGIEIEERYCEIAANRLRQEVLF